MPGKWLVSLVFLVAVCGSCELWIDGPSRPLDSQTQFDACANYLRNIVTVWGSQGYDCLF